jgi:hypothetical protein
VLPGCAATPPADEPRVAIVWNRVDDPHRVCEALSGRKHFFNVLGCSQWSGPVVEGGPRICSIYAAAPRSERDTQRFATLGHELMHCFDGNWHDRWGRMHDDKKERGAAASRAPGTASQAAIEQ